MPALAQQAPWVPKMVDEALQAVAAPDLAQAILRIGLHYAGLASVPEEPLAARRFVIGPLSRGIEQILGMGAAESVVEQLEDLLVRAAGSGEHPVVRPREAEITQRVRHDTPTVPAPSGETGGGHLANLTLPAMPVVVVITRDVHILDTMVGTLHRAACVFGADSIPLLQRRLRAATRPIVVLDAREPSDVGALDLFAEMPEGSTLVIWGGDPGEPSAERPFIPCAASADGDTLAELCQTLITRPF